VRFDDGSASGPEPPAPSAPLLPPYRPPWKRAVAVGAVAFPALLCAGGVSAAGYTSPWMDLGVELESGLRSARILLADQPLLSGPSAAAARRGSAARDVHLPVFAGKLGPGCRGAWLEVGPFAWVCEDTVDLSTEPPIEPDRRVLPASMDGMPYRYFFVGREGSSAYKELEAVDVGDPDMMLLPGFAVAIVAERNLDGAHYGQTAHNLWVPMRDLGAVRSFTFRGEELLALQGDIIPVAWVVADRARVLARPSAAALTSATKARFDLVPVLEQKEGPLGRFFRIGAGAWVSAKEVRHPVLSEPPAEVDAAAGERWIDVDLETQTLVAYEGRRPVFATLVSTGKGQPGTPLGTPRGAHRVWIKLLTSDMDNLEDENASRYYRMENVPWVQYFSKGVGLHGAFWHRSFGQVRSHGCVNVSPLDAERLFFWTSPHLPAGWTAATPTSHELGTMIRVR
jgi:lipoprotein-anchoring transpeptidase ErfK/SrfK